MREWIVGRNSVYEALQANRRHAFRLCIASGTQEKGRLKDILQICRARQIPIENSTRQQLDTLGERHSGVALEASSYPYSTFVDIMKFAWKQEQPPLLLILDTLQDPQNLGTLLRTAESVGVHGVLLPLRHTVTITPAVVTASSGACEHLLVAQINLAQAIREMKEAGLWVIGLENSSNAQALSEVRLDGPLALVVGNEGQGLRSLVRDSCDILLRLPMRGRIASLNAAVAGSIALYLVWQARGFTIDDSGES
jgi:23S rRNA (guanosine2251-2'-O)-methyltransferase